MVVVVAKNIIKLGKVEEFLKLAQELVAETRREKGCIEYNLMRDSERDDTLTFIEKWHTEGHLKDHFEAPHFKRIVPMLGDLTQGETEINIYEEL